VTAADSSRTTHLSTQAGRENKSNNKTKKKHTEEDSTQQSREDFKNSKLERPRELLQHEH